MAFSLGLISQEMLTLLHSLRDARNTFAHEVVNSLIDQGGKGPLNGFQFRQLTWSGHDFVDAVRDDEIWGKTRQGAKAAGGFSVDLLKDLAKGFIRKKIAEHTGVEI